MREQLRQIVWLLNNGSDNSEYLRGQVELVMHLLGYEDDGDELRAEVESWAND